MSIPLIKYRLLFISFTSRKVVHEWKTKMRKNIVEKCQDYWLLRQYKCQCVYVHCSPVPHKMLQHKYVVKRETTRKILGIWSRRGTIIMHRVEIEWKQESNCVYSLHILCAMCVLAVGRYVDERANGINPCSTTDKRLSALCSRPDTIFGWTHLTHGHVGWIGPFFATFVLIMRAINTGLMNWCIDACEINFCCDLFPLSPDRRRMSFCTVCRAHSRWFAQNLRRLVMNFDRRVKVFIVDYKRNDNQNHRLNSTSSIHWLEKFTIGIHGHLKCINLKSKLTLCLLIVCALRPRPWTTLPNCREACRIFVENRQTYSSSPFSLPNAESTGHYPAMTKTTTKLYSYLNVSVNKIWFRFRKRLVNYFRDDGFIFSAHETACNHAHTQPHGFSRFGCKPCGQRKVTSVFGAQLKLNMMGIEMMRDTENMYCATTKTATDSTHVYCSTASDQTYG